MSTEIEPITLSAEVPFYLSKNNEIFGPHLVGEIQGLLDERIISPDDFIWMEGWPEWQPLQSVFALDEPEIAEEETALDEEPEPELEFKSPVQDETVQAEPVLPARNPAKDETREYQEEAKVARTIEDRNSRRVQMGILAALLTHLLLFALISFLAPSLFKVNPYPAVVAHAAPPPLEVALEPEEEPIPPTPTPPQVTAPPPPVEPPPPPAPPVIPMPTPPPPPVPSLSSMPSPPPIADLPVAPTPPQHVATHPKRAKAKAAQAPMAAAPTNQVADAGPSDYLNAPQPDYPFAARQRHETGTVILRVVVSEDGNPTAVTIDRSSGYGILDQSALTTVRDSYRFSVGNSRILLVPITFRPR